jgi:hypothetical protein
MQVGEFHDIAVHDAEFAYACRGQVKRDRRAQAAGPDNRIRACGLFRRLGPISRREGE